VDFFFESPEPEELDIGQMNGALSSRDSTHMGRNQKILLVEDYQPNAFVAVALLTSLGYSCDVASTGKDLIECLDKPVWREYKAVLMDIQLPDTNGYELTRLIREKEKQRGTVSPVPVIAMTAHAMLSERHKSIESGMNDYLMKPIDLAALQNMLSLHLCDNSDFEM
jgi:CheY-like chemotaxis protein